MGDKSIGIEDMDREVVALLRDAVPGLLAVYRFGSFGTSAARAESDIDLAFLAKASPNPAQCWRLAQQIAILFRRDVDLVDLARANTVFRLQVIAHGTRIYCADEAWVEPFEDLVFSAYARLNEERRGILQDIKERGSVYGG